MVPLCVWAKPNTWRLSHIPPAHCPSILRSVLAASRADASLKSTDLSPQAKQPFVNTSLPRFKKWAVSQHSSTWNMPLIPSMPRVWVWILITCSSRNPIQVNRRSRSQKPSSDPAAWILSLLTQLLLSFRALKLRVTWVMLQWACRQGSCLRRFASFPAPSTRPRPLSSSPTSFARKSV